MLVSFNVVVDQTQLVSAQKNVNKLISGFNGLARAAQFALAALGIGKITDSVDEFITIENKLKAVTKSTDEFVTAQRGVERIADELAQPVSAVTDSFLRYQLATESLGRSQEEVLDFTKRVTQAMILSGAGTEEAHRAAVQLAQGFGKNFQAAAQDLKSVKEQAPVLARIIERAAGALPGSLLVAAKAGKVNSKLVFDAVRAAGEDLDRDFAKRQKRFEDISNLLGNQWLRLIKLLKPYFVPVIDMLESVVHWIGEWVKDGSAMNTVIAGTIVVVTALAYAMGGLALSAAAAAAPFIALFFALDELVAFMRGDESFIEDWLTNTFGKAQMEAVRTSLNNILADVKTLFSLLGTEGGPEMEMAAFRLELAFKRAIDRVVEYMREKLRQGLNELLPGDKTVKGPQQRTLEEQAQNEIDQESGLGGFLFGGLRKKYQEDVFAARQRNGFNPFTGEALAMPGGGLVTDTALPEPTYSPSPNYAGQALTSPTITNNIVVQGNADAPVAREIGTQAGAATSASLGRDRAAIGAGFGVTP